MPRRQPTLDDIKALIPEDLHSRTCIAGGFACDPQKARDVDIWVLRYPDGLGLGPTLLPDMSMDAAQITAHLADPSTPWINEDNPSYAELDEQRVLLVASGRFDHHDTATFGMPFHILCANTPALDVLLDWFDLPIHAVGYYIGDPTTLVRVEVPPGPLTINMVNTQTHIADPLGTLTRLIRLSKRYGRSMNYQAAADLLLVSQINAATYQLAPDSPSVEDDLVPLIEDDIPF